MRLPVQKDIREKVVKDAWRGGEQGEESMGAHDRWERETETDGVCESPSQSIPLRLLLKCKTIVHMQALDDT